MKPHEIDAERLDRSDALLTAASRLLSARENQMVTSDEWDALTTAVAALGGQIPISEKPEELWMVPVLVEVPIEHETQAGAIEAVTAACADLVVFLEHATNGGAFEHKPYVKIPVVGALRLATDQERSDILGDAV